MKKFAAQRGSANGKGLGRAKIVIKPIQNEHQRQTTFTKRKRGLRKKVEELSVLCGVDICLLCYSNAAAERPSNLFWGSPGVDEVIARYQSLPKDEREKKKLDNTGLLEALIKKHGAELKQVKEANYKLQQERGQDERVHQLLSQCSLQELHNIAAEIQDKKKKVLERLGFLTTPATSITVTSSSYNQLELGRHPAFLQHAPQHDIAQQACEAPGTRHYKLAGADGLTLELNRTNGTCSSSVEFVGTGHGDYSHVESSVDSSMESSSVSSCGMQLQQQTAEHVQQARQQLRIARPDFLSLEVNGSCVQEANGTDSSAGVAGRQQQLCEYSHVELVPFLTPDCCPPSLFGHGTTTPHQQLLGFFPFPLACDHMPFAPPA